MDANLEQKQGIGLDAELRREAQSFDRKIPGKKTAEQSLTESSLDRIMANES
jgi:hypothetical protein